MLVDVDPEIVRNQGPYSDIKFSVVVQEWLLDVLLNNPEGVLLIFLKNEFGNVTHVFENLDASALVQRRWLHEPHVARTVLKRHSLIPRASPRYLSEPVHKPVYLMIINVSSYHKSCRCGVKDPIL